jgi:hypothetical protein
VATIATQQTIPTDVGAALKGRVFVTGGMET